MKSGWDIHAVELFLRQHQPAHGPALALRTYASNLLGQDKRLVLKGGGNTSVKDGWRDVLGNVLPAVFVKGSGRDLARARPEDHVPLELTWLKRLEGLSSLPDPDMVNALATHRLLAQGPPPSIEALLHVFLPHTFIDHTHPEAILALSNRPDGTAQLRQALGDEILILPYIKPGFDLAKAVIAAWRAAPHAPAMVLMHHGLITWGETARESYEATIQWVDRAENHLNACRPTLVAMAGPDLEGARQRYSSVAPMLRGAICQVAQRGSEGPEVRFVQKLLVYPELLDLLSREDGVALLASPPLTADYLIRTKALPVVIDTPDAPAAAMTDYAARYEGYLQRHRELWFPGMVPMDAAPRVLLLPGMGAVCVGQDDAEAQWVLEITEQAVRVKRAIAASGGVYQGLAEQELFAMEYFSLQQAKLHRALPLLSGRIALVTGAAGAIGAGICRGLLENGAHVAATDVDPVALNSLVGELAVAFGSRILGHLMDVTDPESVARVFDQVAFQWGGLDLLVLNAGVAYVSPLEKMDIDAFRRLERINVEGTLLPLTRVAALFRRQGVGGDVVVISTKNVFAPGAGFGAYSATKAAAHQLARIASLEMAELGVRVNMVAPDAVFSDGARRSGLWAEVGPDRMKARGLDEKGLEEYYRNRNLLKSRVTAGHVARAVLFFATRQTPTTGATIPVDGGLPDATPR